MGGIVGVTSSEPALPVLLDGHRQGAGPRCQQAQEPCMTVTVE